MKKSYLKYRHFQDLNDSEITVNHVFTSRFGNSVDPDQLACIVHSFQNNILAYISRISMARFKISISSTALLPTALLLVKDMACAPK